MSTDTNNKRIKGTSEEPKEYIYTKEDRIFIPAPNKEYPGHYGALIRVRLVWKKNGKPAPLPDDFKTITLDNKRVLIEPTVTSMEGETVCFVEA